MKNKTKEEILEASSEFKVTKMGEKEFEMGFMFVKQSLNAMDVFAKQESFKFSLYCAYHVWEWDHKKKEYIHWYDGHTGWDYKTFDELFTEYLNDKDFQENWHKFEIK